MKNLEAQFADWVEKQPKDREYDYWDTGNCALCQGLREMGYQVRVAGGMTWEDSDGHKHLIPEKPMNALFERPWTFGALAERLRA